MKKRLGNDLYIIIAGLIGLVVFFVFYPRQNPESAVKLSLSSGQIINRAKNVLEANKYNTTSLRADAKLRRENSLLDTLDYKYGRQKVTKLLKNDSLQLLPTYYWRIQWFENAAEHKTNSVVISYSGGEEQETQNKDIPLYTVGLTTDGQLWKLTKSHTDHPIYNQVNKKAFIFAIKNRVQSDSLHWNNEQNFLQDVEDSTLATHLFFDYNRFTQKIKRRTVSTVNPQQLEWAFKNDHNILISRETTALMARYYLRFTPWKNQPCKVDTVITVAGTDGLVARVRFSLEKPIDGQKIEPYVDITAGGGLVELDASFNNYHPVSFKWTQIIAPMISVTTYFLLFLFIALVFIRKIDAKLFDSRTAITVGVIGWFLATAQVLMSVLYPFPTLDQFASVLFYVKILGIPLFVGLMGAFLMFFAFGTGESIVRTVLPSKIETFSMAIRGYIHNRVMGHVFIRSVGFALLLSGIFTVILYFFPHIQLYTEDSGSVFASDKVLFPFISILTQYAYFSLLTGFIVLLGMASYAYHFISKGWSILLTGTIFGALLSVVPISTTVSASWILGAILGLLLSLIYLRFDFLTTVLSGMIFFLLFESGSGWMIEKSPDLINALFIFASIAAFFVIGYWGITSQKTGEEIPKYVPRYVEELAQRERMERELEIARSVQSSFLPRRNPLLKGFEISAICHSALEVGGDYYDFVDLGDGRLGIAIADVSGKGIQAAFYMTLLKGFLQSLCYQIESPAKLLCQINKLFYQNAERGTFISMIYGILDSENHTFTFARAGHNPLVYKSSSRPKARIYKPSGLALGMIGDGFFGEHIDDAMINLVDGDVITLYTDGYTEAMNSSKELFGDDELVQAIEKYSEGTPEQIINQITGTVNRFVNGAHQHDDMTIVVLKSTANSN